jgi:RHS repeat-associated protein
MLYIGTLGEVPLTAGGGVNTQDVFTIDRDYAGQQYQYHSSTAYSAFNFPGAHLEWSGAKAGILTLDLASWGANSAVQEQNNVPSISARKDGYQMDGITIQGVRAYDPTSAQWTSPDAYSGDVNDPMSQKPFMWNNNNPLAYEDPSGYEGSCAGCQGMDPFSNPIPPNIDAYAKAEVHLGPSNSCCYC